MKFKKPNFWDLKRPNFISFLLLPFTLPIVINNFFLKNKLSKKSRELKTICVGNIYLGGTGKTPTTIKLYEILKTLKFKVSTAKKMYKSQKDEAIILQKKTNFITAKNRNEIIKQAINNRQNVVIFDDGLQDRSVSYDLNFVCFDSATFIGNGCLIPSGPLREKLNSLKKYDGVFLKTNHEISDYQLNLIKKYNNDIKIFETFFEIKNLNEFNLADEYLIFSGIGNHESFKNILLKKNFIIKKEIIFPDHHSYKKNEIEDIIKQSKNLNLKIITTEKDYVKISEMNPVNIKFIDVKINIKDEQNLINFLKKNC